MSYLVLFPVRMQLGLCFTLLFFHWILFFGLLLVVLFFSCHFNMIFTCLLGCILATPVPSLLGSFISDLEVVFSKLGGQYLDFPGCFCNKLSTFQPTFFSLCCCVHTSSFCLDSFCILLISLPWLRIMFVVLFLYVVFQATASS